MRARDKEIEDMEQTYNKLLNKPADKSKYASNFDCNKHNFDDNYVPEKDHNWWYVNEYIYTLNVRISNEQTKVV